MTTQGPEDGDQPHGLAHGVSADQVPAVAAQVARVLAGIGDFPGLGGEKLNRLRGTAEYAAAGRLEAARLLGLGLAAGQAELLRLPGIGPWRRGAAAARPGCPARALLRKPSCQRTGRAAP